MIKSLHADDVVYVNNVIVVNIQSFFVKYFSEFKTTLQDDEKL